MSALWSRVMALRASQRLRRGETLELKPRPYTRSSLLAEEDILDKKAAALVMVLVIALFLADLSMEMGSDAVYVSRVVDSGYSNGLGTPEDLLLSSRWAGPRKHEFTIRERFKYTLLAESVETWEPPSDSDSSWCNQSVRELERIVSRNESTESRRIRTVDPDVTISTGIDSGCRWYRGPVGTTVVHGAKLLIKTSAYPVRLVRARSAKEASDLAVELLLSMEVATDLEYATEDHVPLRLSMLHRGSLLVNCQDEVNEPEWAVQCMASKGDDEALIPHDSDVTPVEKVALKTCMKTIDVGDYVQPRTNFSVREIQSFPTSNSQIRSHSTIVDGAEVKAYHGNSGGIYYYGTRGRRTTCLGENSANCGKRMTSCFARRWESDADYAEVIVGLQIFLNSSIMFRGFIDFLEDVSDVGARRVDIPTLRCAPDGIQAELKYSEKEIAGIRPLFLAGLAVYLAAFLAGIGAWLHLWKRERGLRGRPRGVTLESTRRVLAISHITRYNCNMTPRDPPVTRIVETGPLTCHMETGYGGSSRTAGIDSYPQSKVKLLLGRPNLSTATAASGGQHVSPSGQSLSVVRSFSDSDISKVEREKERSYQDMQSRNRDDV